MSMMEPSQGVNRCVQAMAESAWRTYGLNKIREKQAKEVEIEMGVEEVPSAGPAVAESVVLHVA